MVDRLPVTSLTASAMAILALVLAYRAAYLRKKYKVEPGVIGHHDFVVAVRAHSNHVEYAPITIILLALAEIQGGGIIGLYILGAAFVVARLMHAIGYITAEGGGSSLRSLGNSSTWLIIAILSLINIQVALVS